MSGDTQATYKPHECTRCIQCPRCVAESHKLITAAQLILTNALTSTGARMHVREACIHDFYTPTRLHLRLDVYFNIDVCWFSLKWTAAALR